MRLLLGTGMFRTHSKATNHSHTGKVAQSPVSQLLEAERGSEKQEWGTGKKADREEEKQEPGWTSGVLRSPPLRSVSLTPQSLIFIEALKFLLKVFGPGCYLVNGIMLPVSFSAMALTAQSVSSIAAGLPWKPPDTLRLGVLILVLQNRG